MYVHVQMLSYAQNPWIELDKTSKVASSKKAIKNVECIEWEMCCFEALLPKTVPFFHWLKTHHEYFLNMFLPGVLADFECLINYIATYGRLCTVCHVPLLYDTVQ